MPGNMYPSSTFYQDYAKSLWMMKSSHQWRCRNFAEKRFRKRTLSL